MKVIPHGSNQTILKIGSCEVLFSYEEYGSMIEALFQRRARFGTKLNILEKPRLWEKSDDEIVEIYRNALTTNTKLMLVSHMIFRTGQVLPIRRLSEMAHENLTEEQLHMINNPLMIISGYVEFIEKTYKGNNQKIDEKLGKISKEVRRIFEVTQKLKGIKNPIVEKYVGAETTMIDLKKSS